MNQQLGTSNLFACRHLARLRRLCLVLIPPRTPCQTWNVRCPLGQTKGCLNSLFRVEETTPAAKKPRLSLGWHAETNSATSSARVVEAAPAAVARNLLSFGMAELETPPKHDRQLTHQELRDDMVLSGILAGASTECVRGSMANASDRSESC